MMKRNLIAIILVLCMLIISLAGAEGLLPSLTSTIGKPMPSLGEVLGRYPDEELLGPEGSNIEVFRCITETDFNTFSVYLSELGATLVDYRTEGSTFSAAIQVDDKLITFIYDTQTQEATVTYPLGTYDEWLKYAKNQFELAVQYLNEGKKEEALAVLELIPGSSGYKPVVELYLEYPELAVAAARDAKYSVGNYVTFGSYPQTKSGVDKTPIEWLVLAKEGHKVLLISRYGLDAKRYNTVFTDTTWEKCKLRTWLNDYFLNMAFSASEQAAILTTEVDNGYSQGYSAWNTVGGNDTLDKIFLLSYAEANKYFDVTYDSHDNVKSRVIPTAYAEAQKATTSVSYETEEGNVTGWWYLRSPGYYQYVPAYVFHDGSLFNYYTKIDDIGLGCVRPVLWINLESVENISFEANGIIGNNEIETLSTHNGEQLQSSRQKESLQPYKTVDGIVKFGRYEQDNNISNGQEEIEWIVLEAREGKSLLLSKHALDAKPYNTDWSVDFIWEKCSLRTWLNDDFMNMAFSASEQEAILSTEVDNSSSDGGNNTQDKIFLLNNDEAEKYLEADLRKNNLKSRVSPTVYSKAQGANASNTNETEDGKAAGWWWLRSPGAYDSFAAVVYDDGSLGHSSRVDLNDGCVRPALWINLETDIF